MCQFHPFRRQCTHLPGVCVDASAGFKLEEGHARCCLILDGNRRRGTELASARPLYFPTPPGPSWLMFLGTPPLLKPLSRTPEVRSVVFLTSAAHNAILSVQFFHGVAFIPVLLSMLPDRLVSHPAHGGGTTSVTRPSTTKKVQTTEL